MKLRFLAATLLAGVSITLTSPGALAQEPVQPYTMNGTQVETIHSQSVGSDYLLYVGLPRDYEKQSESYPVVIVLDADYSFPIVQDIARFLADHDELRPLIVVGIAYPGVADEKYGPIHKNSRTRDYTPTHVAQGGYGPETQKYSGGAGSYLKFIENELLPHLESKFRLKKDRTIVGYSYGGLFASYAMLTKPALFQRYIIVSPSLWYDNHLLLKLHAQKKLKDLHATAYFAVGEREQKSFGEKDMVDDLSTYVEALKSRKYPSLRSRAWIAEGETHHSIFPGAAMRGIRFVFSPPGMKSKQNR